MSQLGSVALDSKMHYLSSTGKWDMCRFHVAQRPMMLGEKQIERSMKTFLEDFHFESLEAARTTAGMNGILCAAFSEDVGMLRALAESGADVNFRLSGLGSLGFFDGQPAPLVVTRLCSAKAKLCLKLGCSGFG